MIISQEGETVSQRLLLMPPLYSPFDTQSTGMSDLNFYTLYQTPMKKKINIETS